MDSMDSMDIVVDFVVVFVIVCYDDVILTAFQSFMEENSFLCYLPIIQYFVFCFCFPADNEFRNLTLFT